MKSVRRSRDARETAESVEAAKHAGHALSLQAAALRRRRLCREVVGRVTINPNLLSV
jgi:hypothetical protein